MKVVQRDMDLKIAMLNRDKITIGGEGETMVMEEEEEDEWIGEEMEIEEEEDERIGEEMDGEDNPMKEDNSNHNVKLSHRLRRRRPPVHR
jgi:hypothetical protein